jgi:uncharacterized protein (DUF362 family)
LNPSEIHVIYGNDPLQMTQKLLTSIGLERELKSDMQIGIKPNLVLASPAVSGATTHPEIVEGVIRYLQSKGFRRLVILEGSWVGADTREAFRVCGYEAISQQYGVPLIDLKGDSSEARRSGEMSIKVCRTALSLDYLINVPVLKAHCQTELTCALKNLKGCLPDSEKRRFHSMGLHKPIAHLGTILKPGLNIVDAIAGDLTFEEGGNPVQMDRIFAGKDAVLVDAYAASLLGYAPSDIAYIPMAQSLGVGSADLGQAVFVEYDEEKKQSCRFQPSGRAKKLAERVQAKEACSACYGSLIHALHRLDEAGGLGRLRGKICIGQGFRGQTCAGVGVGACTAGFSNTVGGCPPTAKSISEFLAQQCK